jgi:hypothetical protein
MSAELQTVLDRLEHVERQARGWKLLVVVAILLSAASIAVPILKPTASAPGAADRARYSVVEANRFVLRDSEGKAAGGLEVQPNGTIRLVLGSGFGRMGAAFLEVQPDGNVHLTMRGPDGNVRAALLATATPSLALSASGQSSSVALTTASDGSGAMTLKDGMGRTRFRAP